MLHRRIKIPEDTRILICRTDRIGDVVLSLPLIKILREQFPHSYLGFMCRPYTQDLVRGNPYLDEILVYDKYGVHKTLGGSLRFLRILRKKIWKVLGLY